MTNSPLPLPDTLRAVAAALAAPGSTAATALAPVSDYLIRNFGIGVVTVSLRDPGDGSILRVFTSMPEAYETGGRKPANPTDWSRHVVDEQRTFVANDYESLSRVMFDHEKIRGLGMEAIVNIPIVLAGEVIGMLNCLGPTGHFSDDVVAGCEECAVLVAAALAADGWAGARAG